MVWIPGKSNDTGKLGEFLIFLKKNVFVNIYKNRERFFISNLKKNWFE